MEKRCDDCYRPVVDEGDDYCPFCQEERMREEEVAMRWYRHALYTR